MSDQIDPAFKAAYRETQGQPVDAVPRRPIVAAQQDGGWLADKLNEEADAIDKFGFNDGTTDIMREAATALAEKGAQYERLAGRMDAMAADNQRLRAECEGLRAALREAQKTMRNCQGAIESGQVEDKDVRRQLIRGQSALAAALSQKETDHET